MEPTSETILNIIGGMPLRILEMHPPGHNGLGRHDEVCRFDLELTDGVRLYGLRLVQTPHGRRTYAPSSGGRRFATFAPDLAKEITALAVAFNDNNKGLATANANAYFAA